MHAYLHAFLYRYVYKTINKASLNAYLILSCYFRFSCFLFSYNFKCVYINNYTIYD